MLKQLSFFPAFKLPTFSGLFCLEVVVALKTLITLIFRKDGKFTVHQWELWAIFS